MLLDIDTQGAKQFRGKGIEASNIFILPPTLETLQERLRKRSSDSVETIQKRLNKAADEIKEIAGYDYVVVNEDLRKALDELIAVITSNRLKIEYTDLKWIERTYGITVNTKLQSKD